MRPSDPAALLTTTMVTTVRACEPFSTDRDRGDGVWAQNRAIAGRYPHRWRANVIKHARQHGRGLVLNGARILRERKLRPVCKCRMSCARKFTRAQRSLLFTTFYSRDRAAQTAFLLACRSFDPKKTSTGSLRWGWARKRQEGGDISTAPRSILFVFVHDCSCALLHRQRAV